MFSVYPVESLGSLYRYEDYSTCTLDEWDDVHSGPRRVRLLEYPIIKRTPKGVWIRYAFDKRFVLLTAKKRFACETKEDALESFIARKKRQISIYEGRLDDARAALMIAEGMSNC